MNNTELCRRNLHNRLGIDKTPLRDPNKMTQEIHRMTEKLEEIVEIANLRLIMGGIRYGSDWNHEKLMDYMQRKFDLYRETGNFEFLVDLFNFVAIEGEIKTHPDFHFNAVDR